MRRPVATLLVALAVVSCSDARPAACPTDGLPDDPLALPECDVEGFREILADLRGSPVVVNFWGSWCVPCRSEAPVLAELAREYDGRVQFLGVDIADDRGSARAFIREFGWTYPSIFDPREEIHAGMGLYGQPNTLVFDAGGERTWGHTGAVVEVELRDQIEAVL